MQKVLPFLIGLLALGSATAQIDEQQSGDRMYETLDARQVAGSFDALQSDVDTLLSDVAALESVVTSGSNAAAAAGRVNADGSLLSGYNGGGAEPAVNRAFSGMVIAW